MWRFRIPVWLVAFLVLLAPCFLLYLWPIESFLNMLSSLNTVKVDIGAQVLQNIGWLLYVPPVLMAGKAAAVVTGYIERKIFPSPVPYNRRRRW
jgi:hypothetical protein